MIMKMNLEKCGVKVVEAINGHDALEQVVESDSKFDFIVLDLNMPIMNGYESAKKIIAHCTGDNNFFRDSSNPSIKREERQSSQKDLLEVPQDLDKSLDMKSQHILSLYEEMGQVPFLVACSALINDDVTR
jgi:CheY-like chemotaxis protein